MNLSTLVEVLSAELKENGDQPVMMKIAEIVGAFNIKSVGAGYKDMQEKQRAVALIGSFNPEGLAQLEASYEEKH